MSFARKTCKHCRGKLTPERAGQLVHPECAIAFVRAQAAKKERAKAKEIKHAKKIEREQDKARLDQLVKIEVLHKQAQQVFNKWIRARDADKPCISCGAPPPAEGLHAGRDAGHWRSVGSARHLRYNEDNVNSQCVHCNQFLAGNNVSYRFGLVERIGLERVEALENDNRVHKWTREEVLHIRDTYRQKLKELKKTG